MFLPTKITEEMWNYAKKEALKRDPDINHHFNVDHFSPIERDMVGFVGEFCCSKLLNLDWKKNIRDNYKTIDDNDIIINNYKIDVKTESLPFEYLNKLINSLINDDEKYGRRLINENQVKLIPKYDITIFGCIDRDKKDKWYFLGWIVNTKLLKYIPTNLRPDGNYYPFKALPIKTSELKKFSDLISYLNN